jgi:hypothetical protein
LGRRAKLNKEQSIPVAVSMKNWEFLKLHTIRGRKLDDFLTTMITNWSNIKGIKEGAEFYATQYDSALESIRNYRQGLQELLGIETVDDQLRSKITSILGYEVDAKSPQR